MKAQAVFGLILLLVLVIAVVGFIYYIEKITKDKEPPLIGGCVGVSLDNLQECCDNWAQEKGIFVIACVGEWEIKDKECSWKCEEGFCGTSTGGSCEDDSDCKIGGCSSQVCQSVNEENIITTCEYKDCYNTEAYGLSCGCVNSKCKWD